LRSKAEAVECIEALGGADSLKIVHDTFHHHLVGGGPIFPEHTGIVHISGVTDKSVSVSDMRDGHRVLVDADDRLGNVAQIRALRAGGYTGALSFEPFSATIHALADFEGPLRTSMEFITAGGAA
jgi:2-keto-myo-inositol isomerase